MSRRMTIWFAVAAILAVLGVVIFMGVMSSLKWDFRKLSTVKYETNRHEIVGGFSDISVLTSTADVVFLPTDEEVATVECFEQKKVKHTVSVKDGELTIEVNDERTWYEHIGISFRTPKITVRIPAGEYGALSVKSNTGDTRIPADFVFRSIEVTATTGDVELRASATENVRITLTTGDIEVEDVSAHAMELSVTTGEIEATRVTCVGGVTANVSTGDVELMAVTCGTFSSNGSTGDFFARNLLGFEKIEIKRSTGDVEFEMMNSRDISIMTDTGDVEGSLLTGKIFDARSDTGRVRTPDSDPSSGERCKVRCDTGSIKITVAQQ